MKIQFKQTALRIHASLIAIGIWYVLQDNLMSLLVAVLTLFLHEAAHFIAGKKLGFQINEIELTRLGPSCKYRIYPLKALPIASALQWRGL